MPKISIIVPFINGENYMINCLNNLMSINYDCYEIILIDDSSIDNSKYIIEHYLENNEIKNRSENKKIKYYYLEDNTIGVGRARNFGIEKSKGKYIMYVDVDDYIDKNLLLNLDKYMNKNIDLIKYKMELMKNKEGKTVRNNSSKKCLKNKTEGPIFDTISGEEAFNRLCFKDKFFDSPCLYLMKKEYIENNKFSFPENMYHEDFGLIPILVAKAKTVVSTKYNGYKYIQTKNSIMRNNNYEKTVRKVSNKIKHYINIKKQIEKENIKISNTTKDNMKRYYINSIILSLKGLKKEDNKQFKEKIKNLNIINDIKTNNLKQKIKKIFLEIWINY